MLTSDELPYVTARLVAVASLAPSPRQFLVAGLYEHLHGDLGEGTPLDLVDRVLNLCRDDGYRRKPPAMVHLLTTLIIGDPIVTAITERLRTPPPKSSGPFDALVLYSKLPFLDRHPTRAALRAFLDPRPAQPVVVVNGARRAGKTYTAEFVDHVLHDHPGVQHCRIEIGEKQGASVGPAELARDAVAYMGGDPAAGPQPTTNLDRWAQELANWIISVANRSGINWWFVLDGFNTRELRDDTQLLIIKLARSLTTGVSRERHRLILLDFDRSILPLQPGLIADQITAPIPHASVAAAVTHVVASSPQPFDISAVTAKVMAGLGDPVTDLPELGLRLSDLIASVNAA